MKQKNLIFIKNINQIKFDEQSIAKNIYLTVDRKIYVVYKEILNIYILNEAQLSREIFQIIYDLAAANIEIGNIEEFEVISKKNEKNEWIKEVKELTNEKQQLVKKNQYLEKEVKKLWGWIDKKDYWLDYKEAKIKGYEKRKVIILMNSLKKLLGRK